MTATVTETSTTAQAPGGVGRVSRIIGPVVDVEFPSDAMPEQYNLLTTEVALGGETKLINLEVAQHIGDNMVRAISLQPTDGLVRGTRVQDTGGPITVPVGDVTLGRVFNTTGDDGDLILHKWICPPGYDVHAEGADPKVDCTETPGAITFQFGQPGLGEEAMLQDTGDIIEDGVFFSSLEPGEWKMVEFAPEWVESAFIGSCTVNGAPVPADPPLNEGLEWEVEIDSGLGQ